MARYAVYRVTRPDSTEHDWAIRQTDEGGLEIREGKPGSKLRATLVPAPLCTPDAKSELASRVIAKSQRGYVRIGSGEIGNSGILQLEPLSDGEVPEPGLPDAALYWEFREPVDPGAFQESLVWIHQQLTDASLPGLTLEMTDAGQTLSLGWEGKQWSIGGGPFAGVNRVLQATGRGSGHVSHTDLPWPVLVLFALARRHPDAKLGLADDDGIPVEPIVNRSHPWLISQTHTAWVEVRRAAESLQLVMPLMKLGTEDTGFSAFF